MSQPATYHDLICALLIARGKDPGALTESKPVRRRRDGVHRGRPTPVTVHGGRSSSTARKVADDWHTANMPKDWAKTNGSSAEAIAWFMSGD